ncbi:hypothetical protein NXW27_13040 [Phocaeicola dorei]|nr:hypothetical protein [Phocaeicola dorei]
MYNDGGTFTAVIPAQDRDADGTFLTLLFADGTKKDYTLTAKKEFLAGHTTVIPFMGKELQYTFTVSPETIGSGYSGGIYNYETVSNKYYSINGKPLPGTESPLDYTVSTTDVWITPDKAGKTIKVAENLNTAPRNGKVLFTQAESGRTYILLRYNSPPLPRGRPCKSAQLRETYPLPEETRLSQPFSALIITTTGILIKKKM